MTDPIVSPDWLAAHPGAVVLDATCFLPADQPRARAEFAAKHLPGARFFDIDAISDQDSALPHMLPRPAEFAPAAAALGIDGTRPVVVYDRSPNHFSAPRVWFTLRVYGLTTYVLDGGLMRWQAEGRPVEAGEPPAAGLVPRDWQPDLTQVIGGAELAADLAEVQVIDARGAARFRGEAPEPRPGLRSGHMPGAANLPFDRLTGADGRFADAGTLQALFAGKTGPRTVLSCGSGMTAAVLALGLARIGQAARLYDGSWTEWGQGALGPIVTGE